MILLLYWLVEQKVISTGLCWLQRFYNWFYCLFGKMRFTYWTAFFIWYFRKLFFIFLFLRPNSHSTRF